MSCYDERKASFRVSGDDAELLSRKGSHQLRAR